MIDLHGHLCFGVDDGPQSPADSLALARALIDAGVTTFACTSHVRPDKGWMNTLDVVTGNMSALQRVLDDANLKLRVVPAAEHYVDDVVFGTPLAGRAVPYGTSKWLLVECPYGGPPVDLMGLLFRIRRQGYRVLLAHLERFPYVCDDVRAVEALLNAGHLIQVNLGSIAGVYTRAHQKAAERLVKDGHASVLAGDCHRAIDVEHNIVRGLKAARKLVGDDVVHRLTVTNPQAILDDRPAEQLWP